MSESIFDKPLNGDLEALSSSVVKSINGKKPDPITGDITVIEGGGSGSYGAYRLDTTIPVSSWSGSGPYTVTIVNELIKSTMDGKSWLDNDTALLGETTLTSQDGSLLISTTVKPTEDWVLHVSFALNGADVLADSEEQKKAIGKILPVITGTLNNSGYTINSGDYFEANGNLYKASATIPTNESWSSSSDALTTSALSDIHAKIGDVGSTSLQSQVTTLNNKVGNVGSTDLQSQVSALSSNFEGEAVTITPASGVTIGSANIKKFGNIVIGYITLISFSVAIHTDMKIATINTNATPAYQPSFPFYLISDGSIHSQAYIKRNGEMHIYSDAEISAKNIECSFMYYV